MEFFMDLFKHHENYDQKLHPEVIKIKIQRQEFGTTGLQVYKVDGSNEDISWRHCITSYK